MSELGFKQIARVHFRLHFTQPIHVHSPETRNVAVDLGQLRCRKSQLLIDAREWNLTSICRHNNHSLFELVGRRQSPRRHYEVGD